MDEKLFKELEERILITEYQLRQISAIKLPYKIQINLKNQLITMKVLRELYNWRIEKKEIDIQVPVREVDTSAIK